MKKLFTIKFLLLSVFLLFLQTVYAESNSCGKAVANRIFLEQLKGQATSDPWTVYEIYRPMNFKAILYAGETYHGSCAHNFGFDKIVGEYTIDSMIVYEGVSVNSYGSFYANNILFLNSIDCTLMKFVTICAE